MGIFDDLLPPSPAGGVFDDIGLFSDLGNEDLIERLRRRAAIGEQQMRAAGIRPREQVENPAWEAFKATAWGDFAGGLARTGAAPVALADLAERVEPSILPAPAQPAANAARVLARLLPESYREKAREASEAAEYLRDRAIGAREVAGLPPWLSALAGTVAENPDLLAGGVAGGLKVARRAISLEKVFDNALSAATRDLAREAKGGASVVARSALEDAAYAAIGAKAEALAEYGRLRPDEVPVLSEAIEDVKRLAVLGEEDLARQALRRLQGIMDRNFPERGVRELSDISQDSSRMLDEGSRIQRGNEAALNRLLGRPDDAPRGALPLGTAPGEGRLRPPDQPFQYNAESLDLPRSTLPEIKETMELPETLARRRTGISVDYDDPERLAAELGLTEDDFLKTEPGQIWNKEEGVLLDAYIGKVGREMDDLRPLVNAGTATRKQSQAFYRAKDRWVDLLGASMANRSEAGRALESYKHLRKALGSDFRGYLARKMGKKLKAEDLDLLATADLDNPDELSVLLSKIRKPKWWEYPRELFYNFILSATGSFARDVVGNQLHIASNIPVRALRAAWDVPLSKVGGRKSREFFLKEVTPSLFGLGEGASDGLKRFVASWKRTGMSAGDLLQSADAGRRFAYTRSAFARSPSAVARRAAPYVNLPLRIRVAADEFAKGMNLGSDLRARAVRSGMKRGLEGDGLAEHVSRFLNDPPRGELKAAIDYERKMTYTDPMGPTMKAMMEIANAPYVGPWFSFVVPFMKTPSKLFLRSAEFTPFNVPRAIGMAWRGDPRAAEEFAKVTVGAGFMAYASYKAAKGELDGPPPKDAAERDAWYKTGHRPFSFNYGGGLTVPFAQSEPFGMPLSLVAAAWEGFRRGHEDAATQYERLTSAFAMILANQLDRSYFSSLADLIEIKTYGERQATGFFGRQAAGLGVPYSGLGRSINNFFDTRVVEKTRFRDYFYEAIPGMKGRIPGRQTRFGEEVRRSRWEGIGPTGTPFVPVRVKDDEIENALADLGLRVGFPGKSIAGVELSPEEYRAYLREAGQRTKNVLGTILFDETFRSMPQADQQRALDRFVRGTRDRVKAEAMFGQIPGVPPLYVRRELAARVDYFDRSRDLVSREHNKVASAPGQHSATELREAQAAAEESWAPVYQALQKAVADARRRGLEDGDILRLLRKRGLSTRVARALVAGKEMSYSQYHRRSGAFR